MKCQVCTEPISPDEPTTLVRGSQLVHAYPCGESRLFVYGTLRKGCGLDSWLPGDVWRERAELRGYALHYALSHRAYPLLVHTGDDNDVVVGELVSIPRDDRDGQAALARTLRMEERAGYRIADVLVRNDKLGLVETKACVWPLRRYVGERIESGDWITTPEGVPLDPYEELYGKTREREPEPQAETCFISHRGKGVIALVDGNGTTLWEGYSYTALGKWAKQHDVHVESRA